MIRVLKRTGNYVEFEKDKIANAIVKAMQETKDGVDLNIATTISNNIEERVNELNTIMSVELIQDLVEEELMKSKRKDVAKKYIIYRYERDKSRSLKKKDSNVLLTDKFISKYKHCILQNLFKMAS
jgi:ribonucleoside-diphosphate reductase alpha chain/ribonucleoside-triphosphate reductase